MTEKTAQITVAQALDAIKTNHEARILWIAQAATVLGMLEDGRTTVEKAADIIRELISTKP